jgi:hypothetical protein
VADNVDITAGTGTTIATDDCTTGQVQLVKLAYGADGNRTHVPADADGLLVNLGTNNDVALAAGTNNIGDVDVLTLPALPAGTNNIGDVDVLTIPAPLSTTGGGTEATALRVTIASDSTGVVSIDDNGGAITVDNGGTFAVQVDGNALTALQLIDDPVFADDAAFTIGTSKVMVTGGVSVSHGTNPDAADALDAGAPIMNRHRIPFVIGGHPNVVTASVRIADATGAQTDAAIAPGTIGAGTKIVVTRITVTCSNANTVNVAVKLGFGASTIAADSTTGATGVLVDHEGVPPGGGFTIGDGSGILGIGGDGEELRLTCDDPVTGFVIVSYSYYTIES